MSVDQQKKSALPNTKQDSDKDINEQQNIDDASSM